MCGDRFRTLFCFIHISCVCVLGVDKNIIEIPRRTDVCEQNKDNDATHIDIELVHTEKSTRPPDQSRKDDNTEQASGEDNKETAGS